MNTDKNAALKIKTKTLTNSTNKKLLSILFSNIFDFGEQVTSVT